MEKRKLLNPAEVSERFRDIEPFNVIITKGDDAVFLSEAVIVRMCGNSNAAQVALVMLGDLCCKFGVDSGVDKFLQLATEHGRHYPQFVKPLLTYMMKHNEKKGSQ